MVCFIGTLHSAADAEVTSPDRNDEVLNVLDGVQASGVGALLPSWQLGFIKIDATESNRWAGRITMYSLGHADEHAGVIPNSHVGSARPLAVWLRDFLVSKDVLVDMIILAPFCLADYHKYASSGGVELHSSVFTALRRLCVLVLGNRHQGSNPCALIMHDVRHVHNSACLTACLGIGVICRICDISP